MLASLDRSRLDAVLCADGAKLLAAHGLVVDRRIRFDVGRNFDGRQFDRLVNFRFHHDGELMHCGERFSSYGQVDSWHHFLLPIPKGAILRRVATATNRTGR